MPIRANSTVFFSVVGLQLIHENRWILFEALDAVLYGVSDALDDFLGDFLGSFPDFLGSVKDFLDSVTDTLTGTSFATPL